MLLIKRCKNLNLNILRNTSTISTNSNTNQEVIPLNTELNNEVKYPEIKDLSIDGKYQAILTKRRDEVQKCKTVEEKVIKLNMPRYYGWYMHIINENDKIPYNSMDFIQHSTRTHFIQVEEFPNSYEKRKEEVNGLVSALKSEIEDCIKYEMKSIKRDQIYDDPKISDAELDNIQSNLISRQINRVLVNNLSKKYQHLRQTQLDINPRHEAYWIVGGINPPINVKKRRESIPLMKNLASVPVDRHFQYIGQPILTLRHEEPLLPVIELKDSENPDYEVPYFKLEPKTLGYIGPKHRHATVIPGFWPGDPYEFGLLSYNKRGFLINRNETYGPQDHIEALHSNAILAQFAWLMAQASYQGFSTFNDVTYPLVSQQITTNGKYWSFYVYQLNTTLLHDKFIYENPRKNICWGTKQLKLYEDIDDNYNLIGFDENVLKLLISFYINAPSKRNIEMKPYLNEKENLVQHYEDKEKRQWLENLFKHLMSCRPRHRLDYEVYHWEKIYKIDHKTRQMEPRRRPFELQNCDPMKRTLDDVFPGYVPKKLRPEGSKKYQNKFKKTYYP